jgi:hypothetical protein
MAAADAYRASLEHGKPLSERRLAAMFGKTSRRWARHRMAEAQHLDSASVGRMSLCGGRGLGGAGSARSWRHRAGQDSQGGPKG